MTLLIQAVIVISGLALMQESWAYQGAVAFVTLMVIVRVISYLFFDKIPKR